MIDLWVQHSWSLSHAALLAWNHWFWVIRVLERIGSKCDLLSVCKHEFSILNSYTCEISFKNKLYIFSFSVETSEKLRLLEERRYRCSLCTIHYLGLCNYFVKAGLFSLHLSTLQARQLFPPSEEKCGYL